MLRGEIRDLMFEKNQNRRVFISADVAPGFVWRYDGNGWTDATDTLPEAAIIRAMHRQDLTESRDKLTLFLSGWMGGPKLYHEKYGGINIPRSHAHLPIGEAERDAWLLCMKRAIAKQNYRPEFSTYLLTQLSVPAERIFAVSKKPESQ